MTVPHVDQRPGVRPQWRRRFDWDLAEAMHDDGMPLKHIAEMLGVSHSAVYRALDPVQRAASSARSAAFQKGGVCDNCGGPRSQNKSVINAALASGRPLLCLRCASIRYSSTVRLTEPDEDGLVWPQFWCGKCTKWKWMPEFRFVTASSRKHIRARGGRAGRCRACESAARRDRRANGGTG